jgi:hypothetical protein
MQGTLEMNGETVVGGDAEKEKNEREVEAFAMIPAKWRADT